MENKRALEVLVPLLEITRGDVHEAIKAAVRVLRATQRNMGRRMKMAEQRLIDANNYKESLKALPDIAGKKATIELLGMMPTIDPEDLPIVQQLREKLARVKAELHEARESCEAAEKKYAVCAQRLRQIQYCYDIAKNAELQLIKRVDEITGQWAECAKRLKSVREELKTEKENYQAGVSLALSQRNEALDKLARVTEQKDLAVGTIYALIADCPPESCKEFCKNYDGVCVEHAKAGRFDQCKGFEWIGLQKEE